MDVSVLDDVDNSSNNDAMTSASMCADEDAEGSDEEVGEMEVEVEVEAEEEA